MGTDRLRNLTLAGALALLLAAPAAAGEINYIEPGEGNPELPSSAGPSSDLELPLLPVEDEPVVEEPAVEPEPERVEEPLPAEPAEEALPEPIEIEAHVEESVIEEPVKELPAEAPAEDFVEIPQLPETEISVPVAEEQLPPANFEEPVAEISAPAGDVGSADADRLQEAERLLRSGNANAAVAAYENLVNTPGVDAATYASAVAGFASALRAAGRREEAATWYEQALTYNPDDQDLRLAYAYTLAESERLDRALFQLDIVEKAAPGSSEVVLARARALAWNGRFEEALDYYGKVTDPALRDDATLGSAYVLYWLGRHPEARAALDEVAPAMSGNADVRELQALLAQPEEVRDCDASLAVTYRNREDSEDNTYTGATAILNIPLGPEGSRIFVVHEDFDLENEPDSLTGSGTNTRVGFTARVDDRTDVTGYAGRVSIDNTGAQTIDHTEIGIGLAGSFDDNWSYNASYSDNLLYDTPALAAEGISLQNTVISTRFQVLDEDTTLEVLYETGELSDGNSRSGYQLDLRRVICYDCRGEFAYGVRWRDLAFEEDLDNAYFDPETYQLAELYLDWLDCSDNDVKFNASAGLGMQKIDDGDWQQTLRLALGVRADLSDSFILRVGVSHSDLPTNAAQSGDDFDAREWYLNGEWVF